MSFAPERNHPVAHLREDFSAALYTAMQRVRDVLAYRRTLRELNDLDDAALADLGLHRSEIRRVAIDSVYGPRP